MYSALFRLLPGSFALKIIQVAALFLVVLAVLIFVVFPFVEILIAEDPSLNA
jgi:hypothetical protein